MLEAAEHFGRTRRAGAVDRMINERIMEKVSENGDRIL